MAIVRSLFNVEKGFKYDGISLFHGDNNPTITPNAEQNAAAVGSEYVLNSTGDKFVKKSSGWEKLSTSNEVPNISNISYREPVKVSSTDTVLPIGVSGNTITVDGVSVDEGERVLFLELSSGNKNIYVYNKGAGLFVEDSNSVSAGDVVYVIGGTNGGKQLVFNSSVWVLFNQTALDELGYSREFIGKNSAGNEMPSYSSQNYVANSDSLETAIGKLDTALNTVNSSTGDETYIRSFIGKSGSGAELPSYSSSTVVANNDSLEVAIGKLDAKNAADLADLLNYKKGLIDTVKYEDFVSISLPLSSSWTPSVGVNLSVSNGEYVLFDNLSTNKGIYQWNGSEFVLVRLLSTMADEIVTATHDEIGALSARGLINVFKINTDMNGAIEIAGKQYIEYYFSSEVQPLLNAKANQTEVNSIQADLAGKASIGFVNTLSDLILTKAEQSQVNDIVTQLNNKADQGYATYLDGQLNTKASQSALNSLSDVVNSKANQGQVDSIQGNITTLFNTAGEALSKANDAWKQVKDVVVHEDFISTSLPTITVISVENRAEYTLNNITVNLPTSTYILFTNLTNNYENGLYEFDGVALIQLRDIGYLNGERLTVLDVITDNAGVLTKSGKTREIIIKSSDLGSGMDFDSELVVADLTDINGLQTQLNTLNSTVSGLSGSVDSVDTVKYLEDVNTSLPVGTTWDINGHVSVELLNGEYAIFNALSNPSLNGLYKSNGTVLQLVKPLSEMKGKVYSAVYDWFNIAWSLQVEDVNQTRTSQIFAFVFNKQDDGYLVVPNADEISILQTNLQNNIDAVSTQVGTVNTSISTINTNITDIETNISTINTNISTINTNITNAQGDISSLQREVYKNGQVYTQSDITANTDAVFNIVSDLLNKGYVGGLEDYLKITLDITIKNGTKFTSFKIDYIINSDGSSADSSVYALLNIGGEVSYTYTFNSSKDLVLTSNELSSIKVKRVIVYGMDELSLIINHGE